jgi:hypothetical protein
LAETKGTTHIREAAKNSGAFSVRPSILGLPGDFPELLGTIEARIQHERLSAVITANSAMVLLYWDIGCMILERQHRAGWGAKIIDRLAGDLRGAYPDMKGLSPRNLKYMRAFCAAWPDRAIVQAPLAQITWYTISLCSRNSPVKLIASGTLVPPFNMAGVIPSW